MAISEGCSKKSRKEDRMAYSRKQQFASLSNTGRKVLADMLVQAEQAGRKEVVEWIRVNHLVPSHENNCYGVIQPSPNCVNCKWQSQLIKWGLEKSR